VNDAVEDRYVTLVVECGDGTVFSENRTVRGGASVTFEDVVPSPGSYRVVVDTAVGVDGEFDWTVVGPGDTLRVEIDRGVGFWRVVRCDPDCVDVSLGGTSTGYPDGGFDPRGRRAAPTLRLRNAGAADQAVRLRVAEGDVLDYRYGLPSAAMLRVPVPQRSGETRVAVARLGASGDVVGSRTYDWAMERSPTLDVRVGADVRFSCGPRSHDLRLRNADDVGHRLSVTVRPVDGGARFAETFDVEPEATVGVPDVVPTAGDYRVAATTGASSSTADWSTCPPTGALSVAVRPDGRVVVGTDPR
jgi:hypothetical protein